MEFRFAPVEGGSLPLAPDPHSGRYVRASASALPPFGSYATPSAGGISPRNAPHHGSTLRVELGSFATRNSKALKRWPKGFRYAKLQGEAGWAGGVRYAKLHGWNGRAGSAKERGVP
jgi:hypothetical protein